MSRPAGRNKISGLRDNLYVSDYIEAAKEMGKIDSRLQTSRPSRAVMVQIIGMANDSLVTRAMITEFKKRFTTRQVRMIMSAYYEAKEQK